jgi:hypothetical protein
MSRCKLAKSAARTEGAISVFLLIVCAFFIWESQKAISFSGCVGLKLQNPQFVFQHATFWQR